MSEHKKYKALIMFAIPLKPFQDVLPDWEFLYPSEEKFTDDEMIELISDCDAIVTVYGQKLSNAVIDASVKLKMIANFGAGYDNVDVAYASSKEILVTNSPDPVTEPTAELALGLMISVARRMGEMNHKIHNRETLVWGVMKNLSTTLVGKRLGILGMGAIGKALARRAVASGMEVVYHNRNRASNEVEAQFQASYVSKNDLLASSDVVSLNVPLTEETKHLIGEEELKMMKSSAFLINTARGPVVDQKALIQALQNKEIAGAGLDVYEDEPNIPTELCGMENVVLIPHLGTATHETRELMSLVVAQNIKAAFEKQNIPNAINRNQLK